MACSSSCRTQDHSSYGACLRSKSLQVADPTAHKYNTSQHSQINAYVRARHAGLQPASVFKRDVDAAWRITEKTGTPFRADQ